MAEPITYLVTKVRAGCWRLFTLTGDRREKLNDYTSRARAVTAAGYLAGRSGKIIEEK